MTTPNQVRTGLTAVTDAAAADARAVAETASNPADIRAVLFAAAPLIVSDYIDGSAALALDWYDELRDLAEPSKRFAPRLVTVVDPEQIATQVAVSTRALFDLERELDRLTEDLLRKATEDSLALLTAEIQKDVAAGFWDTVTDNAEEDPATVGWKRYARPGACKFCLMLAKNGAIYTERSARFAAHPNCFCIPAPEFNETGWVEATRIQYVASRRKRTDAERAALREYLNHNFPDAPG